MSESFLTQNTDAAWLLDVNALIALIDVDHVHNEVMQRWFVQNASQGWSTCSLTENGVIRVLAQPAYRGGARTIPGIVDVLRRLKDTQKNQYHFWNHDVSLCDDSLFQLEYLSSSRHLTDLYLLGLAASHRAKLVSFDRSLPWQAIRGGTTDLIESPF